MNTRVWNRALWIMGLPLLALLCGCGNYAITFEAADVINTPGGDAVREQLDVDIVCMTKDDVENHPEMANGTLRAGEWFKARDEDDPKIGDIPAKRIYALRRGGDADMRDTLVGNTLLSACDREDGGRTTIVRVHHPQFLNSKSAIVIYGRFSSAEGVAATPPLVIQPPPAWKTDLLIKVGRTSMSWANPP
jgi:hypothetical protein